MKRWKFQAPKFWLVVPVLLALVAVTLFALPTPAYAQDEDGDKFVFGDTYVLEDGDTLDGNLFVFGGIATIEEGATVNGDIMVFGGTLRVGGEVDGNINAAGGLVSLEETAEVDGDVNVAATNLSRSEGAQIGGNVNEGRTGSVPVGPLPGLPGPQVTVNTNPVWNAFLEAVWLFFRSFMWMWLAVLVVLFLPRQVDHVAHTVLTQPLISGGLGMLTVVAATVAMAIMAITLCLIPISLMAGVVLAVAWAFGIIVIGTEVGRRLLLMLNQPQMALPVAAALGTALVTLVINAIETTVPCIGWMAPAIVGSIGLGAVVLTRFGTMPYPAAPTPGAGPYLGPTAGPGYPSQPVARTGEPGGRVGADGEYYPPRDDSPLPPTS